MSYKSIDQLQNQLAADIFKNRRDSKKAAGRALGAIVELITYYTLLRWGLRDQIVIERRIPEFGNPSIAHNVEFSLHPVLGKQTDSFEFGRLPITSKKVQRALGAVESEIKRAVPILGSDLVKRNSALISEVGNLLTVANIDAYVDSTPLKCDISVCKLLRSPFAIIECKRVGVEEGIRKGPQTIEKAKQGAYVAQSVSSLQKMRRRDGRVRGYLEDADGKFRSDDYDVLLREVIDTMDPSQLGGFVLTIGVVSNHGNWFTSGDHNKEMRVLAQSYDRLLFLTDEGLCEFVECVLSDDANFAFARQAFCTSYSKPTKSDNKFTKVRIDYETDRELRRYFGDEANDIESWYNVISPDTGTLAGLRGDLHALATKGWCAP